MQLGSLLEEVTVLERIGDMATSITEVTHDSRAVVPGALFCCLAGHRTDGHDHAPGAVKAGASALLCERVVAVDVPQVRVDDARVAMAPIAAAFHGRPSSALTLVGITGTNGKTTATHLLRSILEADGQRAAVIGTLTQARTTPEAPELQSRLASLRDAGITAVAMEVSSHALELHRVDATWFTLAVFTNLGRDHLDFHGTEEAYFQAKAQLFQPSRAGRAVVNGDDPYGRRLAADASIPTTTFSLSDAGDVALGATSSTFSWRGRKVELALGGRFNIANALAAAASAEVLGVSANVVAEGLSAATPVPGRFEALHAGQPFAVLVDYAHTPDGLEHVLAAARQTTAGRVLVVFGCGGDRDHGKRPAMGEVATRLADLAVLTSDNPRSEDPQAIIDEVRAGVAHVERLTIEPDRRAAIAAALAVAAPGDVVVLAGKGHEQGQDLGDQVVPFDDRAVAIELLAQRWPR